MNEAVDQHTYSRGRWAAGWLDAFATPPGAAAMDLIRGRVYARERRVEQLHIEPGIASARVRDDECAQPYPAVITVPVLAEPAWEHLYEALRSEAGHLAALLAAEPPANLGAAALVLPRAGELRTVCTCPRRDRQPCRHTAAVAYDTAAAIDADPFALLLLRGRTKEQVLAALRERRQHEAATASSAPGRLATAAYRATPAPLPAVAPPPSDAVGADPAMAPIPDPPAVSGLTAAELTELARRAACTARALLGQG